MNRSFPFLFYWAPFLLYCAVIIGLSSSTGVSSAVKFPDKLLHFVEYSIFALLLWRGLNSSLPRTPKKWIILTIVALGAAFAAFDELYQSNIPGRDSSIYDWYADLAGIAGMLTLVVLVKSIFKGAGAEST